MSAYTSLTCYRPTRPPLVHLPAISGFVDGFSALGLVPHRSRPSLKLKFGASIDEDDLDANREEETEASPFVTTVKEIPWDFSEQHDDLGSLATRLRAISIEKPLYRAHISLGPAKLEAIVPLHRSVSSDREAGPGFDWWSLELGPVLNYVIGGDTTYHVGWIGLSLSGYGCLFPLRFRDLIERVEVNSIMIQAADLCRRTWPVVGGLTQERVEGRRLLGDLWPYPIDAPVDWAWGVAESD